MYVALARAEYEQGHYPAAEMALQKALSARGNEPIILNDLAVVLSAESKFGDAETFLKRALETDEQSLGTDDLDVAHDLGNLATFYGDQEKYSEE